MNRWSSCASALSTDNRPSPNPTSNRRRTFTERCKADCGTPNSSRSEGTMNPLTPRGATRLIGRSSPCVHRMYSRSASSFALAHDLRGSPRAGPFSSSIVPVTSASAPTQAAIRSNLVMRKTLLRRREYTGELEGNRERRGRISDQKLAEPVAVSSTPEQCIRLPPSSSPGGFGLVPLRARRDAHAAAGGGSRQLRESRYLRSSARGCIQRNSLFAETSSEGGDGITT